MLAINFIILHLRIEIRKLYKGGEHEDGKWDRTCGKVMNSEVAGQNSCRETEHGGLERKFEGLGESLSGKREANI